MGTWPASSAPSLHDSVSAILLSCLSLCPVGSLSLCLCLFLFSLLFFFLIACLRASSLIFPCPRSNPSNVQRLGSYSGLYYAWCLSSATCTTQWTKKVQSRGIPWSHSPLLKPLASSSLVVKLRRPKSSHLPLKVDVLAQRSELREQDARVAGPCAWQNGKT